MKILRTRIRVAFIGEINLPTHPDYKGPKLDPQGSNYALRTNVHYMSETFLTEILDPS